MNCAINETFTVRDSGHKDRPCIAPCFRTVRLYYRAGHNVAGGQHLLLHAVTFNLEAYLEFMAEKEREGRKGESKADLIPFTDKKGLRPRF